MTIATYPRLCKTCDQELPESNRSNHGGGQPRRFCELCLRGRGRARDRARRRRLKGLPEDALLLGQARLSADGQRICRGSCQQAKPMTEFIGYHDKKDGRPHWRTVCNDCRRAQQRRAWPARPGPKVDPSAPRFCRECGNQLPPVLRPRESRIRCRTCQQKMRRAAYRAAHGLPIDGQLRRTSAEAAEFRRLNPVLARPHRKKPVVPPVPPVKPIYYCRDCGKEEVPKPKKLCKACLTGQYLRTDQRNQARFAANRGERPGMVVDGVFWATTSKCGLCKKLILSTGLCYLCASGRPRTVFRREEIEAMRESMRQEQEAQAVG